jgi:site-specific DNA-cytosine methylase
LLKKQFAHLWVCDSDADVQNFLRLNCPEVKLYSNTDQLLQGNGASVPDVLVAGCPCQPYSSQGLRQGSADPRSSALDDVLKYAAQKKPKILILENVAALAHATHKDTRKKIARILRPSYNLVAKKLNSLQFNVLQRRQRIYLVATLKSVTSRKVIVPDKARIKRKLPRLHKFLGLQAQPELPDVKTWCQTARSNYLAALEKYKCNPREAAKKDLIIDLASSKSRRASCMNIAPTITASHGASRSYFLTSTNCRCLSQLP